MQIVSECIRLDEKRSKPCRYRRFRFWISILKINKIWKLIGSLFQYNYPCAKLATLNRQPVLVEFPGSYLFIMWVLTACHQRSSFFCVCLNANKQTENWSRAFFNDNGPRLKRYILNLKSGSNFKFFVHSWQKYQATTCRHLSNSRPILLNLGRFGQKCSENTT